MYICKYIYKHKPVELQICRLSGSGLLHGCFSIILFTNCVNYCFLENCHFKSDCFIILSTRFILTYMEGKLGGERSSRVDF